VAGGLLFWLCRRLFGIGVTATDVIPAGGLLMWQIRGIWVREGWMRVKLLGLFLENASKSGLFWMIFIA